MHNINDNKLLNEEESFYVSSVSKVNTIMSEPSIISTISSSNNQRYSDLNSSAMSSAILDSSFSAQGVSDASSQFDIIDSLDYDDVDDSLMVDQELTHQELTHQQRESIIRELCTTEKKYFETLDFLLNTYVLPLRKNTKNSSFNFLGSKKSPCTEREHKWLFANIEQIHQVHFENVKILDERLSIWGPTQIISDVIQTWFARLHQQYHIYFENYDVFVTTYERLTRYQPFKKFIESVDKNASMKSTSLLSLMRTPVTCIQRYQRLLSNLANNTSTMHPDYVGLMQCKKLIQQLYEEFKPKIEDAYNVDRVYQIQISMTGQPFSVKAERRLYLQNTFTSVARLNGEDRCYFLFSDILVFARQKKGELQYKGHIQLERSKVHSLITDEEFSIEITSPFQGVDSLNSTFVGSATTQFIRTADKEDQSKWKNCLELVIAKLDKTQHNKMKVKQHSTAESIMTKRQGTTISSGSTTSNN